ncbi:MAG: DUF6029 family protein [Bacteroidales bacterium]|nr:DUF6029 family protein [Bacteroidales bacterium]MDD4217569.1 DUF6029 family protein [Bacteroidales bacterium]
MKKLTILILSILSSGVFSLYSQENNGGQVSGNFQSDIQYYMEDNQIGAVAVDENVLVNSWANFAYTQGNFSAGFRYEGYLNSLLGYPNQGGINDGIGMPIKWAMFNNNNLEITVGNYYEQFGNGLIFRSYEEKTLGVDNAMMGFRVKYTIAPGVYLKGVVGKQRYYWDYGPSIVRGVDGEIQFNDLITSLSESNFRFAAGGSFVSKFQKENNPTYNLPQNVGSAAGRINMSYKGINLSSEYAYKINDPNPENNYIYKPGQAFLINATYSQKGLGVVLGTKWVDNMLSRSDRNATLSDLTLNLMPEISKNHTYTLPAFYPYASQPIGEFGVKANVFYKIPKNTIIGGKYGTTVSLYYSRVHDIDRTRISDTIPEFSSGTLGYNSNLFSIGKELFYQDMTVEISRKWNKNIYTNISYVNLLYNYNLLRGVAGYDNVYAHIGIVDMTYKIKSGVAIRGEFQGMFTDQDEGNWGLGLIELTIPKWFFTVFDNWNYGNPDSNNRPHYLSAGFGFVSGGNRIQITYGKQREGVMCIGGVCRNVPASNGFSLSISSTF